MDSILKNWNLIRIVRLLLGIAAIIYSITSKNYIFLFLGGMLLFQAIMNISCCGSERCHTGNKQKENIYGDQIKKYKPD
ncbi:uncharacterized membrane protein HdeD (DUF308 family) [Dysgonomonas sp. PFB1-18]|uniref:YgaP-like transmembrane domain n=1 Tax=unclassified Dysgonomonas TaxID=2630389 RepID=UPI0024740F8E|nr:MULTISPECIES: YgaP-like transmembrane domain [unclassified Dysgonomonas]MDH6309494.1 uncharacterized membrane protein HdeD (DUF308 family) [Dysgonomonas sp. PF1-14]MDH6339178.1 uncharacterized membrane protein HdeD (DUF308 family) [Dysgonomonas sp. PF1-16]MDH6380535.1 uncharacterized membrane protein HdeD (DUF308 family) [Dysgonomonas sp. PFB1-18]MDH6398031.1 uncharacterized membrane protein HdeD (DUF308 family) [Dysgonomonas sp. PF1-23]